MGFIDHAQASFAADGTVVLAFSQDVYPLDDQGRADIKRLDWTYTRPVGELRVRFPVEPADGRPTEVSLSLADGISPSRLQRFAWSRWLGVAEALHRRPTAEREPHPYGFDPRADADTSWGKLYLASAAERGTVISRQGRPGRRGHPPDHYEHIARWYRDLLASGDRHPTQRIADESHHSRNTVAGWIRRCRELGYLPPARRGRAG